MFEEEHHGLNQPETNLEMTLRGHWIALGLLAALGAGGNVDWARGALGGFGMLGPILLFAYHSSVERRPEPIVKPYLWLMLPWWIVVAVFLAGILHPAFILQEVNDQQFWEMLPPPPSWVPLSGQLDVAVLEVLFVVGLYAATVNALIIPQNRMAFARTWVALAFTAGLLAVLGLAQYFTGTNNILWMFPLQKTHFFATFPHSAQWCAFAILWMGVCLSLTAWLVRQRTWRWLASDGWSLLALGAVLGLSVAVAGDPLHWLLGSLVAATGCFALAWQTLYSRKPGQKLGVAATTCLSAGVALLILACATFLHQGGWLTYNGDRPGVPLHSRVMADTLAMWEQRPWFGWGHASFQIAYGFFQQADQEGAYWAYARSDLLQSLAENGLVGTLAWWLPAAWVCWRIVRRRHLASFLFAPLAALAALVVLSVVDFPLACPAVFFGFWLILFSLCRWNEIDDETNKSTWTLRHRIVVQRSHHAHAPENPPPAPTAG